MDAYQAGDHQTRGAGQERRAKIAQRREALRTQHDQQARLRRQAAQAQAVLEDLHAFCAADRARLDDATFEEKQAILQLLIERIIVGDDTLGDPPRHPAWTARQRNSTRLGGTARLADCVRMVWTRQRCQLAPCSTAAMAPFSPSWASLVTSRTPAEPAADQPAQERSQKAPSSLGPTSSPSTSRSPVAVHPDRDDHRHRDHPPVLADLHEGGVQPHVRVGALQRPAPEALDLRVQLLHRAG